MDEHRYFVLNKPFDMVSQFVSSHKVRLLGDLAFKFPIGTHAIGRLDNHSEGLLLLTTDKRITRLLFQSAEPHRRTYVVQVKNHVSAETIDKLKTGVSIRVQGGVQYLTPPCDVGITLDPPTFSSGLVLRSDVANTWLRISLTEGKYHQVRKMVKAIHHPCKRLIRVAIEDIELEGLLPGEVREMNPQDFFQQLKLKQ